MQTDGEVQVVIEAGDSAGAAPPSGDKRCRHAGDGIVPVFICHHQWVQLYLHRLLHHLGFIKTVHCLDHSASDTAAYGAGQRDDEAISPDR